MVSPDHHVYPWAPGFAARSLLRATDLPKGSAMREPYCATTLWPAAILAMIDRTRRPDRCSGAIPEERTFRAHGLDDRCWIRENREIRQS